MISRDDANFPSDADLPSRDISAPGDTLLGGSMTKDERRIKIICMIAHMKADLLLGNPIDIKYLADLMDMRRAFNESN